MKLRYLFFGCFVMAMSACQWGMPQSTPPDITTDTLLYAYQTITENKPGCTGDSCLLLQIKYPLFKNNQPLNDSIQQFTGSYFLPDGRQGNNLPQSAKIYLRNYNIALKDAGLAKPEDTQLDVAIIRQDSSLLTIELSDITGLRKTNQQTAFGYYANYDVKRHHRIALKDILANNDITILNNIADTIFRKQEKISDTASLKTAYFFKDGAFTLSDNFLITPTGLIFRYNPMDIKPLNAGQTEIAIPYSKIKSLLLPHTVISQYIK